jgi:hypothetical protein
MEAFARKEDLGKKENPYHTSRIIFVTPSSPLKEQSANR